MGHRAWRRSLQLRMVTITLLTSSLLVGAFGYLVVELTTRSLVAAVDRDAEDQVTRGAENARTSLRALGPSNNPLLGSDIRRQVVDPLATSPERGQEVMVALVTPREVVGVVAAPEPDVEVTAVLPDELRDSVGQRGVSRQIITAQLYDEQPPVTYLVYGSPVPTEWPGQEASLYYFFPLTSVADAANNIRTVVLATGATLVLLLAVVTGLVTRLVVHPVRVAARTAQRLAAGLLDQRMAVRGEDDLALLAASFNQMAGNLQRQIVRLEEMSRLQRRFTSDVSHELRTPLTTVRMAADLIFNERESYPPEVARSAELLQHELDRFESLLSDLLEISRFDAGFAALESEPVDLVPVVRQTVERLAAITRRSGSEVRLRVPQQPVIAEVDQRRVDRVLRNLVENAVEHGEGRPVEVRLDADSDAAAITVRDRGVGMRTEECELVFNRFWRADPSRARQSGGTGLGLSISLEDARLHGGWLQAWGAPGAGAQFRLTLPLRAGDELTGSPLPLVPSEHAVAVPSPASGAGDRAGGGQRDAPAGASR
ncbi:HAMP domain-containing histidine kinase [Natronosporangium hydrolyticum]|uniref:Sensor histidine kinase MtrB n=1 Tax=Natronosporangium hydrolyticum TaxID=2811111 RepID=A0A895YTT9_9ACTN|nr:MtrAB system histidine kinase MtrB [Natronosporangium hydrolyticum]QSB17468.1 HAMP domain-containing histidine kinase [Natronosporangium hydrolyticum]